MVQCQIHLETHLKPFVVDVEHSVGQRIRVGAIPNRGRLRLPSLSGVSETLSPVRWIA